MASVVFTINEAPEDLQARFEYVLAITWWDHHETHICSDDEGLINKQFDMKQRDAARRMAAKQRGPLRLALWSRKDGVTRYWDRMNGRVIK